YLACRVLHQHLCARSAPISLITGSGTEPDSTIRPPRRRRASVGGARRCIECKQTLAGPRQHDRFREYLSGRTAGGGAFDGNGITDAQSAPFPAASIELERITELYGPVGEGSRCVFDIDKEECIRSHPFDPGHNSLELHLPAAVVSRGEVALRKKT